MSRYIDNVKWSVERLTNNKDISKAIEALFVALEAENKARNNFEAFVNIRQIRTKEIDLPEEGYGEEWEVLTGHFTYEDENGGYTEVECEIADFDDKRDEIEGDLKAESDELSNQIADVEEEIAEVESDIEEEDGDALTTAKSQLLFLQQKLAKLEERKTAVDDAATSVGYADFEYDEILWNTLYQYDGDVDHGAAVDCGLAIVRVGDEEYLGLTCCGMDLTPKFFCYQALACGGIEEGMAYKLKSNGPDYFKHCVSESTFTRAMEALGISEYVDSIQADLNARMKKFDENIASISRSFKNGDISEDQKNLLAILALGGTSG
jgi:hypothetical protein